ncbi:hypothetical protein UlMin_022586 [Ulmus minor]
MPKYANFLKEVLSNKRRLEGNEKVMLTEECSAILQRKLPQKLKDPGSFPIPCTIGDFEFDKVLCDLGASINLMPLSIFRKLGLGEVKPTTVTLQLADRSIKHPRGIIEDVLVKVDKFIFPADFIVLDMEEDREVPLILGRPFLATVVAEKFHESFPSSSLENCIVNGQIVGNFDDEEILECVNNLDALPIFEGPKSSKFRELGVLNVNTTSSIKEPPKLELKELPSHLRYAFLEESSYYPVIINSSLNDLEEEKLLRVLREHRKAIGWTIDDIKGISPSICMHKILMEETYKPLVQLQRRLNPSMQEFLHAFETLKEKLISSPIIVAPDWELPFTLMCDASDYAIGAVLGQRKGKIFHVIYYASKVLNDAQLNYATTEKELLAVVYAFDKFRSYLIGSKVIVYTDHSALRYLFAKKDAKPRLLRWILLL